MPRGGRRRRDGGVAHLSRLPVLLQTTQLASATDDQVRDLKHHVAGLVYLATISQEGLRIAATA
jgi:hypothetical protein